MKNGIVKLSAFLCCTVLAVSQCHPTNTNLELVSAKEDFHSHTTAGVLAAVDVNFDDAVERAKAVEIGMGEDPLAAESKEEVAVAADTSEVSHETESKDDKNAVSDEVYGYKNIGIANVRTSLNVRDGASRKARRIGKMEPDSACEILGYEGDWAKITSGDVTGYVMSSYLFVGEEAAERAKALMSEDMVTVQADVLRVRAEASTNSRILKRVSEGTHLAVVDDGQDEVSDSDGKEGKDTSEDELIQTSTNNAKVSVKTDNKGSLKSSYADTKVSDNISEASSKGDSDDDNSSVGGWVEVDLGDGCVGYVSKNYVITSKALNTAISTVPVSDNRGDTDAMDVIVSSEVSMDPGSSDGSGVSTASDAGGGGGGGAPPGAGDDPGGGISSQDDRTIASAPEDNSEGGDSGEIEDDSFNDSSQSDGSDSDTDRERDSEDADADSDTTSDSDNDGSDKTKKASDDKNDSKEADRSSDETDDRSHSVEELDESDSDTSDSGVSDVGEDYPEDKSDIEEDQESEDDLSDMTLDDNDEDGLSHIGQIDEDEAAQDANLSDNSGVVSAQLADYAMQFLGNPYVWGGSSLTNGADCSGFVMTIFAQYGVSLPHSSAAQSVYGTRISAQDARPGDLFFYGSPRISHVGIYVGNGQIIHASNKKNGIKLSSAYYQSPVCVTRLIQ